MDALFGALLEAGLSERLAVEGYALLFQFAYGEAIDRHRENATFGQRMVPDPDPTPTPTSTSTSAASWLRSRRAGP